MPLIELPFAPGVVRDDTAYAAKGKWYDADKIRFRVAGGNAWPQTIGGWDFASIDRYSGVCRGLHTWLNERAEPNIAVGTNLKLYDIYSASLYDVTPTRLGAVGTLSGAFQTMTGQAAVLVTQSNHSLIPNDIVVYTSGTAVGGISISGAYAVTAVVNSSQYTIVNPTSATGSATGGGFVFWKAPRGVLTNPFNTVRGSTQVVVNHSSHGQSTGDVIVYETLVSVGGTGLVGPYQITVSGADQYVVSATLAATTNATASGGLVVYRYPRFTLSGPFSTTIGTSSVTVTQVGHLLSPGDYRIFNSGTAVGGLTISGEYSVVSVPTSDTFTIYASGDATSTASGGGTPTYVDLIPVGLADGLGGYGYGVGAYGIGAYGLGQTLQAFVPRTWSFATWNNNQLLGCPWGQGIFLYQNDTDARGAALPNGPRNVNAMFVTPEAFCVALGCTNINGVYDPMLIRIADQATLDVWTPTATNQARQFRPVGGSQLMAGIPGSRENLIFSDTALFSFRYIGDNDPLLVYEINIVSAVGLIGPKAVASNQREGVTWFLGNDRQFYAYRGGTPQAIPCPNRDWFFEDFAPAQEYKIHAGYLGSQNEVWWFVPTLNSANEIGRYMILNTVDLTWSIGTWDRTAWIDRDASPFPVAASFDAAQVFYQEYGSTSGGAAFTSRVKSAPIEFEPGGTEVWNLSRGIFDAKTSGVMSVTVYGKRFPNAPVQVRGPFMVTTATQNTDMKMQARQFEVECASMQPGDSFRLGMMRVQAEKAGKR